MRYCVLALVLCGELRCASIDGNDDNATSDEATSDDGASDATMSTSAAATSASSSSDGDQEGDGDTSGGMSGCEGGPLSAPIAGCTPTPAPSTDDFGQDCVDRINQFRWECQCLPPLLRWTDAETCTDQQSGDDQGSGAAHGNFGACSEFAQNTCPNWPSQGDVVVGCLQAMWDEGPGEPFEEHGHYINMSNPEYTKVACGSFGSAQGVWSNQNFSF